MSMKYQIFRNEMYRFTKFMKSIGYQKIKIESTVEAARFRNEKSGRLVLLTVGVSDVLLTIAQTNADIYRGYRVWKLSRSL